MEPKLFTQCVAKLSSYGLAHPEVTKGLIIDNERQCYSLHWSIPKAYQPYLSPSDDLEIIVGKPDLAPGASLSEKRKSAEMPMVYIRSLLLGTFAYRVDGIKVAGQVSYGLKKSGRTMYGRQVYESTKDLNFHHDVVFYPDDDSQPIISCGVGTKGGGVDQIKPYTGCKVRADIDGHVYAEYHLLYSLMPQFEQINAAVIGLIRSFIVNK